MAGVFSPGIFEPGVFAAEVALLAPPSINWALQSQIDLFGGLYKWSDFQSSKSLYKDRLDAPVQIELALPEIFHGIPRVQQIRCRVKEHAIQEGWAAGTIDRYPEQPNTEVNLADLSAAQDILGWAASGRLYDLNTSTAYLSFDGLVADVDAGSGELIIENIDLAALAHELPRRRLIDLFPNLDLSTAPTNDPRVIKCFGEMRQVRLTKLSSTPGAYLYGAVVSPATIATVYRGRRVVTPATADYEIVTLPGSLIGVRFRKQPVDSSGRELEIHVDVTSTEFATHADVIKWAITGTRDGLRKQANTASFTTAAADYTTAGYLVSGGIGPEPIKAEDLLNQLALRGAVLALNSAGEWTLTVDKSGLHTAAQYNSRPFGLGRGDGHWENVERLNSFKRKRLEERAKSYSMQGLWSGGFGQGSYLLTATASRVAEGVDMPAVTNPFIGDLTTLRKECGYRLKRLAAAEQSCTVEVVNEARVIGLNQTVPVVVPSKRLSLTVPVLPWQCTRVVGSRDNWTLELSGYDSSQYSATAADFTSAPAASVLTDYSFTPPDAPTGFQVVTSVFVVAGDKAKSAIATLEADAPAANVSHLVFQAFRIGSAIPLHQRVVKVTPGQQNVQVDFRFPVGTGADNTYDLQCFARNVGNNPDFQDGTVTLILGYVVGTDTTPPDAPTGLTATVGTGKAVGLNWNDSASSDHSEFGVYRHTSNSPGAATKIAEVAASAYVDVNVAIGTTYWYWVTDFDKFENESAKSSGVSATPVAVPADTTPPADPAALTFNSSGTYQASDGKTLATINMLVPSMPSGASFMNALFRRNGASQWLVANQLTVGGGGQRYDDLTPGINYDFALQAFSAFNIPSAVVAATGNPHLAPGDSTAPAQVTGLALSDQPPRALKATWNVLTAGDLRHYQVDVATNSGFSAGLTTRSALANEIVVPNLTPGTTYFVRVRGEDWTGNTGTFSSTQSRAAPRTGEDDIGDDTLGTAKFKNLSVTNAKINDLSAAKITTGLLTVNPTGSGASGIVVTNSGSIDLRTFSGTPASISFQNSSGVEQAQIIGDSSTNLRLRPNTSSTGALYLGELSNRWAFWQGRGDDVTLYAHTAMSVTSESTLNLNVGNLRASGAWLVNSNASTVRAGWHLVVRNSSGTELGKIQLWT